MGNIVPGYTLCPICGNVLQSGEGLVFFPIFSEEGMEFSILDDTAVHLSCFLNYPLRFQVRDYLCNFIKSEDAHPLHISLSRNIEEILKNSS